MRQVLIESGINYVEVANEAVFYGPKIDVQVWSVIGRELTIATKSEPDGRGLRRARWWPSARTSAWPTATRTTRTDAVVHPSRAARNA
jgi:hypothetical protein